MRLRNQGHGGGALTDVRSGSLLARSAAVCLLQASGSKSSSVSRQRTWKISGTGIPSSRHGVTHPQQFKRMLETDSQWSVSPVSAQATDYGTIGLGCAHAGCAIIVPLGDAWVCVMEQRAGKVGNVASVDSRG
jgi:hypothetical protein